jgi:copper transport protein
MTKRAGSLAVACCGGRLLVVLLAALVLAQSAAAHAILVASDPGNDAVVQEPPRTVSLRFSEPVESAFGSVRVYDSHARRVDDGHVGRPDEKTVQVGIERRLERGTYTVAWRIVSADAHAISGTFVFHVGALGASPEGIAADVVENRTPRDVTALFAAARFLDFALLLLVVGGAVGLAYPLRTAGAQLRRRLLGALAAAALLLALAALAGIILQGVSASGLGLGEAARWDAVSAVLDTRFGKVWLAQAGLALAVCLIALAAARRPATDFSSPLLVPAVALVATPALSGHASVSGDLSLAADLGHVAAASVWTGGLAFLVAALLAAGAERWTLAARAVPRFSTLAVVSVAVLIAAGAVNGYEQVGAWRGLWDTTYGVLLLAKVALVLPLLALAAYNSRYAVPRLRRELASRAEQLRFLRMAGAELVIVVAIVGVTSVLVAEPPARASMTPRGPFATTVTLGELEAHVVADPAVAGPNLIELRLTGRSGEPADVDQLRLTASLPDRGIGPLRFEARPLAPGYYAVRGARLARPGDWQVWIEARRGKFEAFAGEVAIPIRKAS